jgi:hypothetical protein
MVDSAISGGGLYGSVTVFAANPNQENPYDDKPASD